MCACTSHCGIFHMNLCVHVSHTGEGGRRKDEESPWHPLLCLFLSLDVFDWGFFFFWFELYTKYAKLSWDAIFCSILQLHQSVYAIKMHLQCIFLRLPIDLLYFILPILEYNQCFKCAQKKTLPVPPKQTKTSIFLENFFKSRADECCVPDNWLPTFHSFHPR